MNVLQMSKEESAKLVELVEKKYKRATGREQTSEEQSEVTKVY